MPCRRPQSASAWIFTSLQLGILLLVLLMPFLTIDSVQAGTIVRVVETWPPGNYVTLGRNEYFYLRLAYETDTPVHIWVRPYFNGKPANAGSHTSPGYSGTGETFGWFFFDSKGGAVDEVRILAGDGSTSNTSVVAVWRGDIVRDSAVGNRQPQPAWIAEMTARTKAAQDEAYRARMREPVSRSETALVSGFALVAFASGLFGLFMPAWAVWRWNGFWRTAAAVPAVMMAFVMLRIVVDGLRDPTSHNLLPFELLMWGSFSTVMMVLLYGAHKLFGGRQ